MFYKFKKYISILLFLTLSIYLFPKELIHDFFGHTDTVDHECNCGYLHFEKKHIHCLILNLTSLPFVLFEKIIDFFTEYTNVEFNFQIPPSVYVWEYNIPALRAPPLIYS